jgi:hypothetical protein
VVILLKTRPDADACAPTCLHVHRKEQYEEALSAATQQYSEVLEEEPEYVPAMNNWGAALHSLAEIRDRAEALALLQEASAKFEQACSLASADFEAANNHADALAAWATLLARDEAGNLACGPDSEALWARAYDGYAGSMPSMQYDFDRVNCLCNWSTALSKHAELKQEQGDRQAAYGLFIAAAEKLRESCRLSRSDPDGFVALVRLTLGTCTRGYCCPLSSSCVLGGGTAQCVQPRQLPTCMLSLSFGFAARLVNLTAWRPRLQAEAQKSAAENAPVEVHEEGLQHVCASYREALHINASHLEATAGLGETMLDLGRLLLGQQRLEEAHSALTGAGDLLFQYLSAREADETALHNLACVCSLLGRVDECQVLCLPVANVL